MCGIIGVINENSQEKIIKGLLKMEYRGYDSCGIAYFKNNNINNIKTLESPKNLKTVDSFNIGIGHTRWATHGKVNEINAHPILCFNNKLAIVHNGVIENSNEIKELYLKDICFKTDTDTEVLINLISLFYLETDLLDAMKKSIKIIKGSYAFLILNLDDKESIYLSCDNMPLIIGKGFEIITVASDVLAFDKDITKYYSLPNKYIGKINIGSEFSFSPFNYQENKIEKINRYHMYDEIISEKECLNNMYNEYFFDNKIKKLFSKNKSVCFIASGSSYNACKIGEYFLNKNHKNKTKVYLASEFIYNDYPKYDIYFIVSQSGETADTIKALKKIDKKALTISLTNVKTSTIALMSKINFDMLCGKEIGVASTKAYLSSIFFFYCLFNKEIKFDEIINSIDKIILDQEIIYELAKKMQKENNLIFLGRGLDGLLNFENILKIKEITYMNVESYFGGELKHGPLALIDNNSYIFVINNQSLTNNIMRTNSIEVETRGGNCYIFSSNINKCDNDFYSFIINDNESIFPCCVFFQLFAYYLSILKGNNPDRPKNLAKSVTVE